MSLAKTAQLSSSKLDKDLLYITDEDLSVSEEECEPEDKDDKPSGEVIVLVTEEPKEEVEEISFELPLVPGGDSQDELEDENDLSVEEEEDKIEVAEPGVWDWKAHFPKNFHIWLKNMMSNPPKHTGLDSVGIERCVAYFQKLNTIISQAVRLDVDGVLNINLIEKAREEIHKAIDRLNERLDRINSNKFKKKKKADEDSEVFVKEAQKAAGVYGRISVVVPLLISHIARVCINSVVSAGKNLEQVFDQMAKKYELTTREKAELIQLLCDMGFPLRHREVDLDSDFDASSENNPDYIANYFA